MTWNLIAILLWVCAIGSGLIAGVFFAFSTFIMTAFARIPPAHGISAMQSINSTILGSLFMPVFFGTALASIVLAGIALFRWGEPPSTAMLAGGSIYFVGMFACTIAFNVPLNKALASVSTASTEAADVWANYLRKWNFWNHVRTAASIVACVLFIVAIRAH